VAPHSTYRVQLHSAFGFEAAAGIAPYLADLGVTHLYCSPYLQAVSRSMHGYDVVDPQRLSEDLGGATGHATLVAALRAHRLGQVLDIVPNHMAVADRSNHWWWEVLEDGPSSRYARYFDIDWTGSDEKSVAGVLVPVLGDHYGRVVESGEIRVEREGGSFVVHYHDHELPLSPRTYDDVLEAAARVLTSPDLADLARQFASLPDARRTDPAAVTERHTQKQVLRRRLLERCEDPAVAKAIDAELDTLNADPDRLDRLLQRQNYRLAFWRTANEELDYRRFFNIETLVGLRIEDEQVFADTHRLVLALVNEGIVDGLRVDHIDGLRDPRQYLDRLRAGSRDAYTVVEKILAPDEELPDEWPVEGTTGYDFLARVNNLFVASAHEAALTDCYQRFSGLDLPYEDVVYQGKQQVVTDELASEVDRLTRILVQIREGYRRHRDRTWREVHQALIEVLAAFPVYRAYVQPGRPATDAERRHVAIAVQRAVVRRPDIDPELLGFLGELVLLEHPGEAETEFALRFGQVSAPIMAKGVEDTAFYRYNRLISLNEVGGAPEVFGRGLERFHADMGVTAARWPDTMLTLSTHDTKRSADVRARINLLSELPEAWDSAVARFAAINDSHRRDGWPDHNTEYLLYQTVIGAWPIGADRLVAFMAKASREAKVHTSWVDPVPAYEQALESFVRDISADHEFLAEVDGFLVTHRIVERGRLNSIAQVALLMTCPGNPDLYQGDELWDLSLVDPDNRRPVDYARRAELLADLPLDVPPVRLADDDIGVWKLWVLSRLLRHRRDHPRLYRSAVYEPLPVRGPQTPHAVAFTRGDLAVVVPRLVVGLDDDWRGTEVDLGSPEWTNLMTGEAVDGGGVPVSALLRACPVAVLTRGTG
jgi:(1->4)-alpha-D-glucan 1-alpha-D-glucosylmutase